MSEPGGWGAAWRVLAENELRGAPLSSLLPRRVDALALEAALGPDPARDEGLPAPSIGCTAMLVTARPDALSLDADAIWWRSSSAPPTSARVRLHEPALGHAGGPSIGDAGVEAVLLDRVRAANVLDVVALTAVHERGASPVVEVAIGVLAAIAQARIASSPVRVAIAVGPELFVEIAKLRALRRLAARALATLGLARPIWIAARTSDRCTARLDVATNAIRTTLGAAAAMIGGADVVGVCAMDDTARAARLARNVPEILARESSLVAIDDPARGSFAIEAMTDRIARDAYEIVRDAEGRGGIVAARASLRDRIVRDADARRAAVRSRRLPLVGVSKYPLPGDTALAPVEGDARDAAPFEGARAAPREAVRLVVVGAAEARTHFVRELLEVGGFEVGDQGRAAIVCAPDAAFADEVPRLLADLRARGAPAFVAGKPGAHEAALGAAGAAGFIALGDDVIAFFDAMRSALTSGAPS